MKSVVIGAADQYTWFNVKNWAKSIKQTGFEGDVYLICYRVSAEIISECTKLGIICIDGLTDEYNNSIEHAGTNTTTKSHHMRFLHAHMLLTELKNDDIQYVIMTDVRDVVFQTNPETMLSQSTAHWSAISGGEYILYEDEPWGKNNLLQGYGPLIFEKHAESHIGNVGTLGGTYHFMTELFLQIYLMGRGRFYPNDQSSFNVLAHGVCQSDIYISTDAFPWAANLGTTMDPSKSDLKKHLISPAPTFDRDVGVINSRGEPYVMVHQYDRVPELAAYMNERF